MEYVPEASTSSASHSGQVVEEDYAYPHYSHLQSLSIHTSSPSSHLPDSYTSTSGTRQPPYMETPSERRARLEFVQREREKKEIIEEEEEDRSWSRVSSWVQNQVENSAFMVMAAAATVKRERRRSSGAKKEPRIVRPSETRSGSPLRFSHIPSDCEEDEEACEEMTIPHLSKTKYPLPASVVSYPSNLKGTPRSSSTPPRSSRTSKNRRRRRLVVASSTSSLDSIPEE